MLAFPIRTTHDDDGSLLVTCDLLPEVTTFAMDEASARANARNAIEEALAGRIAIWGEIELPPVASPASAPSPLRVELSLLVTLKVLLFLACKRAGVSRAELARRLCWHREQVDRLFRLEHASRVDQIEAAFAALGTALDIETRSAA